MHVHHSIRGYPPGCQHLWLSAPANVAACLGQNRKDVPVHVVFADNPILAKAICASHSILFPRQVDQSSAQMRRVCLHTCTCAQATPASLPISSQPKPQFPAQENYTRYQKDTYACRYACSITHPHRTRKTLTM